MPGPKAESDRRIERIVVLLTKAEKDALTAAAVKRQIHVGELVRNALKKHLKRE